MHTFHVSIRNIHLRCGCCHSKTVNCSTNVYPKLKTYDYLPQDPSHCSVNLSHPSPFQYTHHHHCSPQFTITLRVTSNDTSHSLCSYFVLMHSQRQGKLFLPMALNFSSEVFQILDYKTHFLMLPSLTITQMHSGIGSGWN